MADCKIINGRIIAAIERIGGSEQGQLSGIAKEYEIAGITLMNALNVAIAEAATIRSAVSSVFALLKILIETVVIIETLCRLWILILKHRLAALASILHQALISISRCDNNAVGIIYNETIEVFV